MANTKLIFYGTERSGTNNTEMLCYFNAFNEIFIHIRDADDPRFSGHICLDKPTAIKLAKTLRTEINKMEVDSGNI